MSSPPGTGTRYTAALPCDATAVAGAARISRARAEALRSQEVAACEAGTGSNGATSFSVSRTVLQDVGGHDVAALVGFDGGPLPSGCSVSGSGRLYLLVDGAWLEGRQVGCDATDS